MESKKSINIILVVLVVIVIAAGIWGYSIYKKKMNPANKPGGSSTAATGNTQQSTPSNYTTFKAGDKIASTVKRTPFLYVHTTATHAGNLPLPIAGVSAYIPGNAIGPVWLQNPNDDLGTFVKFAGPTDLKFYPPNATQITNDAPVNPNAGQYVILQRADGQTVAVTASDDLYKK